MTAAHPRRSARNAALAAIHIARKKLGLDDETYRAIVRRVSAAHGIEVDSSADMDRAQIAALLDEFRKQCATRPGAHKPAAYPGKPHNFATAHAMPEMITKIEAQLASMGLSWAYADAIAKRQCGIARCAWVRDEKQLRGIIAALDVEQTKRDLGTGIDEMAKQLGMDANALAKLTAQLPKNWRRNRRCLKYVAMTLEARVEMLALQEINYDWRTK